MRPSALGGQDMYTEGGEGGIWRGMSMRLHGGRICWIVGWVALQ